MSDSTGAQKAKNRKAERKQKRQLKLQEKAAEEKAKLDVLKLLAEEKMDTKPGMAAFLKQHILSIRVSIKDGKMAVWPAYEQTLSKAFVKLLDGQELIWNAFSNGKIVPRAILLDGYEEATLSSSEVSLIVSFFEKLQLLGFL